MIKAISILAIGAAAAVTTASANSTPGEPTSRSAAAQRDYERLWGTWQLTRAVVNGRPVPANVLRNTILVTDRNTFRFPKASGVGTHPAGRFTVNPDTRPAGCVPTDRKSTRLNSSHVSIAYAVFCLKKKNK